MLEYIVSQNREGALRSLPEALAKAKQDSAALASGEGVLIRVEGLLQLTEPICITAEDLPGADHPVLVEGADETAGFSGGLQVTGFTRWKENIWRVHVPEVTYTRNLYLDGKLAKRPSTPMRRPFRWDVLEAEDFVGANFPGEPDVVFPKEKTAHMSEEKIREAAYTGIATTHTEIAGWKNIRELEMVFEAGWIHRVIPMEWVKPLPDGRVYIKPLEPVFHSSKIMGGVQTGSCPSCIENVFELLGKPGEWYFDRTEQMLYLGLAEGDTPDAHEIVIPRLEQLLRIEGTLEEQPCHLCFCNLRFLHTTWLQPWQYGMPETQANQMTYHQLLPEWVKEKPYDEDYRKAASAVRVIAGRDVSFERCTFTAMGAGALQYDFGSQDCRVLGNHFHELAGSALTIGDFWPNRAHHPENRREILREIRVANNHIHHIGREFRGAVAIIAGYVQDVTIAHNEIHDVSYTAISMGWGWGSADVSVGPYRPTPWKEPSVCMRNRILNNWVYRCMMDLCDGGAIYTLGYMPGTVIAGNYIHNSAGFEGDGYNGLQINGYDTEDVHDPAADPFLCLHGIPGGIYMDEGSSGLDVFGNIIHDVAVPLNYHNQIDKGYTRISCHDNVLNKRPGDPDFPAAEAACAGREPAYR